MQQKGTEEDDLVDITAISKQIYEKNQQELADQMKQFVAQEKDKDIYLCFKEGTYICNALTQYPKEELRDYTIPFRDLMFENARIRNVKSSQSLISALMTTYGFESELLEPLVKSKVRLIIVNDNSTDRNHDLIEENYGNYPNWTVVMPAKRGEAARFVGAYHPKIWFLKFPNFLRIVIGSQNLHLGDWTIWAQGMWVQDFPKRPSGELQGSDLEFRNMLLDFMAKTMPRNFDFQKELGIKLEDYALKNINIRLVQSVPGTFKGNQIYQYGSMRVQSVVNEELIKNKFEPFKKPVVTYQSTSLGDININYIRQLTAHFTGKPYKKSTVPDDQKTLTQHPKDKGELKLVYPTYDYVVNQTHGGVSFASTLWLRMENYQKQTFPKEIFHRYEGSEHYFYNTGSIPHIKAFIVTEDDMQITDQTVIYVGSHNLSGAAWGKLEKNDTQINICNTELGVLYPPGKNTKAMKEHIVQSFPFKFPPDKYDQDTPFMQQMVKD